MKKGINIKLQAFLMLFILMVSSIGLPIISHECAHDNVKDVHLFSSNHHKCKDKCDAPIKISSEKAFQKEPCCSFDTSLFFSDVLITSKNEVKAKDYFFSIPLRSYIVNNSSKVVSTKTYDFQQHHKKAYGLNYRIVLQSFLC